MADFGPRKDAEIQRMSTHKVAAELMKILPEYGENNTSLEEQFIGLANWLDQDIADAGQRAIEKIQKQDAERVARETTNGHAPADIPLDQKLNKAQQAKLLTLLDTNVVETQSVVTEEEGKISSQLFKLQLNQMSLPNVIPHADLVKMITLEQGQVLVGWINRLTKPVADD